MAEAKRDQNFVTSMLFVGSDGLTYNAEGDKDTGRLYVDLPGGSGTVTSVSVATANGFAGTVADPTTTPAITLSTTITGILQGNGTAISAITVGSGLDFTGGTLSATATGTIDGTLTANELVYGIDSNTIGSLAVATYPSLTELSYVKGVTSAIQTQLNAKQATISVSDTAEIDLTFAADTLSASIVASSIDESKLDASVNASLDLADTSVQPASTNTLTNKRITRRLVTVNAPGATPSTNTDNLDIANFTGLATAITSMTTNLSGTPVDGDLIEFRFTDDGTARAITWGASFGATTVALPTTTVISTMLRILFEHNGSIWQCIAVA